MAITISSLASRPLIGGRFLLPIDGVVSADHVTYDGEADEGHDYNDVEHAPYIIKIFPGCRGGDEFPHLKKRSCAGTGRRSEKAPPGQGRGKSFSRGNGCPRVRTFPRARDGGRPSYRAPLPRRHHVEHVADLQALRRVTTNDGRRSATVLPTSSRSRRRSLPTSRSKRPLWRGERRVVEADLGPVKNFSTLLGQADEVVLRWFILVVALLLDPAAVLLSLAATRR
jgi:hypothetical protein